MKDQTGTQRAVAVSPSRGDDGGCKGGGREEMGSLLSYQSFPTDDTPSAKQLSNLDLALAFAPVG
jgi:hypothetical protein